MFPRHVRWYRLLLFVLVLMMVDSEKAIAKTESNLNLDTGTGIIITCPVDSISPLPCSAVAPLMPPSFTNSFSDGDAAAFLSIGGSFNGTPDGDIIILGIETGSGTQDGCHYVDRQFLVYDDINSNGVLESGEFVQSCNVVYNIGDSTPPFLYNPGDDIDITCDGSTYDQQNLNEWLYDAGGIRTNDCGTVSVTHDFSDLSDICSSTSHQVTFSFTDECGNTVTAVRTINIEQVSVLSVDCNVINDLLIDCNTTITSGQSLTEYIEDELGNCGNEISATSSSTNGGAITVEDNFLFTGSGTNQDIIYTGYTGSGSNQDLVFITGSGSSQDIIFTISDISGNTATCSKAISLNLSGTNNISIVCDGSQTVTLGDNGTVSITPNIFVDQIIHECLAFEPYTYEIACTAIGPCGSSNDLVFGSSKSFCCDDANTNVGIIIRLTDSSGNSATCTTTVAVEEATGTSDNLTIECFGSQNVNLNSDGSVEVQAENFVEAITDACGSEGPYTYEIARVIEGPCGTTNDLVFESEKTFCCEEVGSGINVIIKVTDQDGNTGTCSSIVQVLDPGGYNNVLSVTCNPSQEVVIQANGTAIATPQSFVNLITNACGSTGQYTYQIARSVVGPCGTTNDLVFENTKSFCCEEEGTNVTMIVRVTDENGNSATCSSVAQVQDPNNETNNLSIVCSSSQSAILEANGIGSVAPENFVLEVVNNCVDNPPYTYQIARMVAGPCGTSNDLVYENTKSFCCAEVGTNVSVFIRVTDASGNSSSCMTTVEVEDLIAPVINSCPTAVTVSCSSIIDLNNLSQFGSPSGSDNCQATLSEVHQDLRDDCGIGQIIRTFTYTDASSNSVSCSQVITVYNDQPFTEANIIWPIDQTYNNLCNEQIPSPEVSGAPSYPINSCSSPLVTHTDQVINFGPGCFTVNRTWVIIDWCQFDGGGPSSNYRWEHTQVLTIENNIAPIFSSCESYIESCGNELSCTGMINYSVTATDDCTGANDLLYIYTLTLEDGTVVNGIGNSINSPYPYGEHSLVWSVTDQCGNHTTCAQTIKIKDCKPPQAVCLSGVNINLTQTPGMAAQALIWASDIDASSSDNCTETSALEFAFDTDFTQTSLSFGCNDIGNHNIVLYVRDADGNVGLCKSTIGVQDNFNYCGTLVGGGNEGDVLISGRVATEANLLMEEVDVMLENTADPMHYMTDTTGTYAFSELPMYENFKLVPSFEDEALNGISTADIILIQRHLLGLQKLDSPYKIIAADINNSESITAIDIIELRKIILGIQDEFKNSNVWRFVDSGFQFVNPESPFPYNQTMNLTQLDHNATDMNFVGVKTGDVNYSAFINGFIPEILSFRSSESLSLVSSSLERGSIQLTVNEEQELSGFQLAFRSSGSLDQLNLSSSIIQIDESNFAIEDDIVKISWSSAEAIIVEEGEVLFSLYFDGETDFQLLNDLPMFNTEAYNASINSMNVEINTETKLVNNEWQVFRNTPNPFVNNTFIPFTAPSEAQLSLSVFDVNGKMLHSETRKVAQGYQKWELSASDIGNVHGVLYYRLESTDFSSTQPFIRLK